VGRPSQMTSSSGARLWFTGGGYQKRCAGCAGYIGTHLPPTTMHADEPEPPYEQKL
jgi:hypothetical protein